ncbi:hypothetical protein ACFX2K_031343 [Malus domestica]
MTVISTVLKNHRTYGDVLTVHHMMVKNVQMIKISTSSPHSTRRLLMARVFAEQLAPPAELGKAKMPARKSTLLGLNMLLA